VYDIVVTSGTETITNTCTICVGTPSNGACAQNRFLRRMQGKSAEKNPNKGNPNKEKVKKEKVKKEKVKKQKKPKKPKKPKKNNKGKKNKNKGPFQCPADWNPLENKFECGGN